jgi:hypothetical protein
MRHHAPITPINQNTMSHITHNTLDASAMSSTRRALPKHTIKVEESSPQPNNSESARLAPNLPRKRAREDFNVQGTLETTSTSSGHIESEDELGKCRLPIYYGLVYLTHVLVLSDTCCDCGSKIPSRAAEERERLHSILKEAILMKDAIIEQNESLASELRRTRHELHRMRMMMGSAGQQLQEEAAKIPQH